MKRFVLGEFARPEAIVEAAGKLQQSGVKGLDTYSPYPLHGIDEVLGMKKSPMPLIALIGGLTGACGGYYMMYWMNVVDWPINVGGRPSHGFWTNIPITFECGILFSVLSIFLSSIFYFFAFPQPYHPVFESEQFRTASLDAFWLSIETDGDDVPALEELLQKVGARRVHTVTEAA